MKQRIFDYIGGIPARILFDNMSTAVAKILPKRQRKLTVDTDDAKVFLGVIADCYERKSIIITTNLEFSKWNEIFYDDKLTAAIIDRIVHHSHLLDFRDRKSWRLENSIMNQHWFNHNNKLNYSLLDFLASEMLIPPYTFLKR